jgi:hypothetical protein
MLMESSQASLWAASATPERRQWMCTVSAPKSQWMMPLGSMPDQPDQHGYLMARNASSVILNSASGQLCL